MLVRNTLPELGLALEPADEAALGPTAAAEVERYLAQRSDHVPTPLVSLPGLATSLGLAAIHVKDEGQRLGLGSFKALGGAYAVVRLVLAEAGRRLGGHVAIDRLYAPEVAAVARGMTFGAATDGNHGRSVAAGAQLMGATAAIFVHESVSPARVAAIARYGARIITVPGTYDDAVAEAARVCAREGWLTVSDTAWPGYEEVPRLVMQGYTALMREALVQLDQMPSHVFVQAGVGGIAAAVADHLLLVLGERRPTMIVVEPARAAGLLASLQAGRPVRIAAGEPTVMAMLECYEPSLTAWRILARCANAFMTVEEDDAVAAMRLLGRPRAKGPAIVAGESGGVGLAGLVVAAGDSALRADLRLGADSRVLLVNTEGATDDGRYQHLMGH